MSAQNTTSTTTTLPPFTLSTPPGTDIWRKPPTTNSFSAPTHPSPLLIYPLPSFHRAKLTFTLPPAPQLRQYDQAGLLLHFTHPSHADKWIKTGIEFYFGAPYLATVGTDTWSDWSLAPIPGFKSMEGGARPCATVEARRESDELGRSLWIYWFDWDEEKGVEVRRPLREVGWVFAEEEGWSVGVGGYVARPTKIEGEGDGVGEGLEAEFEGVEIEVGKE